MSINGSIPNSGGIAAVDVGSNTIRLLVAGRDERGGLRVALSRRETTRLATGLADGGRLSPAALRLSGEVVRSYVDDILQTGAEWVLAVGTGALRDSADGPGFADAVLEKTGLIVNIIDQRTETLLTLQGMSSVLGSGTDLAAIDIGGRSTEVALHSGSKAIEMHGLKLGAVGLYESFISGDPPSRESMERLGSYLNGFLREARLPASLPEGMVLAGTGGTVTTLAALDMGLPAYDRDKINRYPLSEKRIRRILGVISALDLKCRAALPGMEPGRADIILSGASLALALMRRLGRGELTVSDAGILEGCAFAGFSGDPPLLKTPAAALRPA